MTDLDCSVVGCVFNNNNSCKRENIKVGGSEACEPSETACRSFSPRGTNTLESMACDCASKPTNVACDAVKCKFNVDKNCHAKHIGIAGKHAVTNGETECGSFEMK